VCVQGSLPAEIDRCRGRDTFLSVSLTILKRAAIGVFAVGAALLVAGLAATAMRSDGSEAAPDPTPTAEATATRTPTARPTATGTPVPPTPTPTPFAGNVARFQIPQFNVDSEIEILGLDAENRLEDPEDPHATGWYDVYGRPGWGGNSVFAAHVDYFPSIRGPFYNLIDMEVGDEFQIVMADGTIYVYELLTYERYEAANMPMGDLIYATNKPAGEEWITLITCGGTLVRDYEGGPGHYLHRDVVIAKLVERHPA
jgi:sortase (surface protein transpeptidase)